MRCEGGIAPVFPGLDAHHLGVPLGFSRTGQSEPTDSHGDTLGVHIAKRGKVGFDFRKGISRWVHWTSTSTADAGCSPASART